MTIMIQMKMMCIGLEKRKLRYERPVVTYVDFFERTGIEGDW